MEPLFKEASEVVRSANGASHQEEQVFDRIKSVLTKNGDPQVASPDQRATRIRMAACVVLLEAAHSDNECTTDELDHVIEIMTDHFAVSREDAAELVDLAHRERRQAIDLWQFTNEINQRYSRAEKMAVMEAVWRIIYVDGHLEKHEDFFAHKLAKLLRLPHKDLIEAKLRAKA
jgi:uncharacterized tellurite resistance protein B-like protein